MFWVENVVHGNHQTKKYIDHIWWGFYSKKDDWKVMGKTGSSWDDNKLITWIVKQEAQTRNRIDENIQNNRKLHFSKRMETSRVKNVLKRLFRTSNEMLLKEWTLRSIQESSSKQYCRSCYKETYINSIIKTSNHKQINSISENEWIWFIKVKEKIKERIKSNFY